MQNKYISILVSELKKKEGDGTKESEKEASDLSVQFCLLN